MAEKIEITLTGDASSVVKEYQKLQKAQDATNKKVDESRKTAREAAAENRRLNKVAEKALRDIETGAERAEREMGDLNKAFKAGKLSASEYDRAVTKLQRSSDQTVTTSSRMAGSVREMKTAMLGGAGLANSFAAGLNAIGPAGQAAVVAIGAVVAAAKAGIQKAREFDRQEAATSATIDRMASRIQRQGGRAPGERLGTINSLLDIADETAYVPERTAKVIEAGISNGLGDVDRNGVAQEIITGIQAMNLEDDDPVAIVETVARILKAFDWKPTSANVREAMQRIHGSFEAGTIQLPHVTRIAENAPMMALTGESFGSALAMQTSFQELGSPEQVRTGIQNVMKAFTVDIPTQDVKKKQVEALGLTPGDLALGDQSLTEALTKLGNAMDRAGYGVDERAKAMGVLFGAESASMAISMVRQVRNGDVANRFAMQADTGAYDAAATAVRSDLMAIQTRDEITQVRTDIGDSVEATRNVLISKALDRIEQDSYQRVSDGFGSSLKKAAIYSGSRFYDAVDFFGGGANAVALYDAAEGTNYLQRINEGVAARDPNLQPQAVPGGVQAAASLLSMSSIGTSAIESLVQALRENTASNRQNADTQPGVGTQAVNAQPDNAVIVREPMPVPVGGAFP